MIWILLAFASVVWLVLDAFLEVGKDEVDFNHLPLEIRRLREQANKQRAKRDAHDQEGS